MYYVKQENTEEKTEEILRKDTYLAQCLKEDGIAIEKNTPPFSSATGLAFVDIFLEILVDFDSPVNFYIVLTSFVLVPLHSPLFSSCLFYRIFSKKKRVVMTTKYEICTLFWHYNWNFLWYVLSVLPKLVFSFRRPNLNFNRNFCNGKKWLEKEITTKRVENYLSFSDLDLISKWLD